MDLFLLAFILAAGVWAYVVLARRKGRVLAALGAINAAGAAGLGWFIGYLLFYDGFMLVEITGCIIMIAILGFVGWGALALERTGKAWAACVLLAAGSLPVLAVGGLLIYLEFNPIVWR